MKLTDFSEGWSDKYKKSIDCDNPKGFSQEAHCAGRKKKKTEGKGYNKMVITPHQNLPSTNTPFGGTTMVGKGFRDLEKAQAKTQTAVDQRQGAGMSRIGVFKNIDKTDFSPEVFPRRTTPKTVRELKIVKPNSVDTKGFKRAEMPQIHKNDYNEFIDYLKDNGAKFTKQNMPAKQLKATQGEFSDKGVMKQLRKQLAGEPRKPVIASQDNYIIDGHHRWLVAWNTKDTLEVFKVNIDADDLLKLMKNFPKTTYKDIYTEELYDFDKEQPMKSTVAVPGYGTMSVDGLMKNLVQSVTELLGRMKQGTDGMRFADYELNKNKVLTSKLSALIQALDDLQAIRKQGGARSRNIQKESFVLEDGWFDYYKKVADIVDPVRPTIKKMYRDQDGNPLNPNDKDHMKAIADQSPEQLKQLGQQVGRYIDTPAWQTSFVPQSTLDRYGITRAELPKIIALRDKFKKEHPKAFELIKTGQADKAWQLMRNESISEQEEEEQQEEMPIDTDQIFNKLQEFESKQFISTQDADFMRRAIQSLTAKRQTVYPEAILKLLTLVTQ